MVLNVPTYRSILPSVLLWKCLAMVLCSSSLHLEPPWFTGFDKTFPPWIESWYYAKTHESNSPDEQRIDAPVRVRKEDMLVGNNASFDFPSSFTMEVNRKRAINVRVHVNSERKLYILQNGFILVFPFPSSVTSPAGKLDFIFHTNHKHCRVTKNVFWSLDTVNKSRLFLWGLRTSNSSHDASQKELQSMKKEKILHSKWLLFQKEDDIVDDGLTLREEEEDERGDLSSLLFTMMYIREGNKLRRAFLFHLRWECIKDDIGIPYTSLLHKYVDKWVYMRPDDRWPILAEQGECARNNMYFKEVTSSSEERTESHTHQP